MSVSLLITSILLTLFAHVFIYPIYLHSPTGRTLAFFLFSSERKNANSTGSHFDDQITINTGEREKGGGRERFVHTALNQTCPAAGVDTNGLVLGSASFLSHKHLVRPYNLHRLLRLMSPSVSGSLPSSSFSSSQTLTFTMATVFSLSEKKKLRFDGSFA